MSKAKAENISTPTIHLNGSPAKALQEALADAYRSIGEALGKLHETAPHARDYYVQKPGAFAVAQDQYFQRLNALVTVRNELLVIREGIDDQLQKRKRGYTNA